jgi:uncharacterized protein (DUF3084 family)
MMIGIEGEKMNLDEAIATLKAREEKLGTEFTAIGNLVVAALTAREAEAASKTAVGERARIEAEVETFRQSSRAEVLSIATELTTAREELANVKSMVVRAQQAQRDDYKESETKHEARIFTLEGVCADLRTQKIKLVKEIEDLQAQKKQIESFAASILPKG